MPAPATAAERNSFRAALSQAGVLPVVTIHRVEDAVPLARTLVDAGLPMLEITLRSDCALAAIERIRRDVPAAYVGAGTILERADLVRSADAGARFAISPGASNALYEAASGAPIPWLPAVRTPSEVMQGLGFGHRVFKFFPAACGAAETLHALRGPFPGVGFVPTGGVDERLARRLLDLPNVVAVGGSWMLPAAAMKAQDRDAIARAAGAAAALVRPVAR